MQSQDQEGGTLLPGGVAQINEAGNQQPCWDSEESMDAFIQAVAINDDYAERNLLNSRAVYLQRDVKVRRLTGSNIHLRIEDSNLAGTECWEPDGLHFFKNIKWGE
jgi:hypothetical protein